VSTVIGVLATLWTFGGIAYAMHYDYQQKCDKAAADYYRRLRGERVE